MGELTDYESESSQSDQDFQLLERKDKPSSKAKHSKQQDEYKT